jgi:hypothetical protein
MTMLQSKKFFSSSRAEKEECAIGDDVSCHIHLITSQFTLRFPACQNMGWSGLHGELLDPIHQKVSWDWSPDEIRY